jgi:hypothetical protein
MVARRGVGPGRRYAARGARCTGGPARALAWLPNAPLAPGRGRRAASSSPRSSPAPPRQGFLVKQGIAIQVAATLLVTTGDNPGRVRREASFAALCGASLVDASSGKQLRHRLNRGGDRQANAPLWTIAMTRLAYDPRTQAYVGRRTAEGKTNKEIIRCHKRYITREVHKTLCRPIPPGGTSTPQLKQDLSAPALT